MAHTFAKLIALSSLMPLGVIQAQVATGIGPLAASSSSGPSNWRTTGELSGSAAWDSPFAGLRANASLRGAADGLGIGSLSLDQIVATPARGGLRLVLSGAYRRNEVEVPGEVSASNATASLSYRRGSAGAWLGQRVERNARAAIASGLWRQLGENIVVAVASTIRRGPVGGRTVRHWTETGFDSIYTDTGGVKWYPTTKEFTDTGGAQRLTWAETEARFGWSHGRLSLDAVLGWRPMIDTSPRAAWMRTTGTVALTPSVALSVGTGTTTQSQPFMMSTGRYAFAGIRFAPAALVRPKETPEVTGTAASFAVSRVSDGEVMVRLRLPRARVVELAGDFNGWQSVRLTRDIDGTWIVALPIKPGTYRMNVRIDGEQWVPPPGAAAVDDEFNGRVGLVVIR